MSGTIDFYKKTRGAVLFMLLLSIFFGYELGNRPFADPDEGRYVEIPREMVVSGDYITPRLNGLKYFEKPPLFYWLQSASIKVFGINETSMRLWSAIFAILGCLSVFFVCWHSGTYISGIMSACILATNLLYYTHSRLIILDMALTMLISGALWCFFLAFVRTNRGENRIYAGKFNVDGGSVTTNEKRCLIIAMYVLSALACLIKGLIGVVLPAIVIFLWVLFTKNWGKIKEILYVPGLIVFFAIFLPWHIIIYIRNNDFFYFYFLYEHFVRYTTEAHQRFQPVWYFIFILILGIFPWGGFSFVAIKNAIKSSIRCNNKCLDKKSNDTSYCFSHCSEKIFLLSWIFGILAFFSFSSSKLIPYILPIFPPIAYLTGSMIAEMSRADDRNFKMASWITIGLLLIFAICFCFTKHNIAILRQNPDIITLIYALLLFLVVSIAILFCAIYFRLDFFTTVVLYTFLAANMMWIINKGAAFYQDIKRPSTKGLAAAIKMNKNNDELVFCYRHYYQDFPVYLNSTVGVVDYVGELEFGKNAAKNNHLLLAENQFWNVWNSSTKRIFLLLSRKNYRNIFATKKFQHKIFEFDKNFIVITNK